MPEPHPLSSRDPQASSAASSSSSSSKGKKRKQSAGATSRLQLNQTPSSSTENNAAPSSQNRYQQSTIPSLFASSSQLSNAGESSPSQPKKIKPDDTVEASSMFQQKGATHKENTPMAATSTNVIDLTSPGSSLAPKTLQNKDSNASRSIPTALPPRNGARKIVVKNLKKPPKAVPDTFVEKTWALIDAALTAIFEEKTISTSMEELYRGTENLCRAEKSPFVYESLEKRCTEYVSVSMKNSIITRIGRNDDHVVKTVGLAWSKWCRQLGVIRSILFYLDRSYLLSSPSLRSIWDMGLHLFCEYIVTDSVIKPRFLANLFSLYDRDRRGDSDPEQTNLLVTSIRMISNLALYATVFEPKFIDVSEGYYRILANEEAEVDTITQYANVCVDQMDAEVVRCERYHMEQSTKRELISIIETELILQKIEVLKDDRGIAELIDKRDVSTLTKIYSLIDRVADAGKSLKAQWGVYITKKGLEIVADQVREAEMVSRLLDLKEALDVIWTTSFQKSETLGHTLRESFESFINEKRKGVDYNVNSKPSEMIAKYVDLLLRTGVKALTSLSTSTTVEREEISGKGDEDAQLAVQLEQVLDLFRCIHGKDVFEAFYKKDLARRLLMGRSASADAEKMMLSKLKTECGSGFTMNLEIMFKDIDLSRESMVSFKNSRVGHDKSHGIDLSVSVLSQAAWPTYPETVVNLPVHVAQYLELYHQFYTSKHKGRKLMWRHALAHCVLKADYPKGNKDLAVSSFQAVVLLLFNDTNESLGYQYIKDATALTDIELARTLQSLACGKYRVLLKSPKSKEVNTTDKFAFNPAFTDPKMRIKINQIQLKETKEENKATHEQINQDRQYETQAAIIRIMKSRKTVTHTELVQQTIEQTRKRGVLDVADIKKNIERLIDKDYMERTEKNMYAYVA